MPSKSYEKKSENNSNNFVVGSGVEPLAHRFSADCSTMNTPRGFLSYHNQFVLQRYDIFFGLSNFKELFLNSNTEYLSLPISFKLITNIDAFFETVKLFKKFRLKIFLQFFFFQVHQYETTRLQCS